MIARPTLVFLALILTAFGISEGQCYPERTVTIVVPASAGGVTDFIGRLIARHLSEKLGASVVVENRVGGGTLIGANVVAKAAPDGHTLMVMPLGTLFNSIISKTMPVNFEQSLVPVSVLADQSLVLVVHPDLPVTNVKELIAYAKKYPNKISYGTVGPGSLPDVAVQLICSLTDTEMVGVPYGGSTPALMDLISGRIHLQALPLGSALPYIASGKLRAIGVTSPTRDAASPDIPSISEGLPDYSLTTWQALMITGGTPRDIIDRLNNEVHAITADPQVLKQFKKLHLRPRPPVDAAKDKEFIMSEFNKWQKLLRKIGLAK